MTDDRIKLDPDRMAQRKMHQDFFDRCLSAIEHGFYMEAILMEYAALEARLEVILGMLGLPCNKFLPDKDRKDVFISHRIQCLKKIRKNTSVFSGTKLPKNYFDKLEDWITIRNGYIHGLYKSEIRYKNRMKEAKQTADQGYKLCRLLYNEASRIRRLYKKNAFTGAGIVCMTSNCKFNADNKGE